MTGVTEISLGALDDFPLPGFGDETDKDSRGCVLVVAGGAWGPGATLLAALAALRSGAGKVQAAAAERFAPTLAVAIPEAAILTVPSAADGEFTANAAEALAKPARKADALVIGPGVLDPSVGAALATRLTQGGRARYVIDAGALTGLDPEKPLAAGRMVLTPHAGEMAKLLGCEKDAVLNAPLAAARRVARGMESVVVMKGADTFIVAPDGRALAHRHGVVGLGTSGSGDVLAGLVGGLLAQGAEPLTAAAWAVCVHAAAGRRLSREVGAVGFLARELLDKAPGLIVRST